MQDKHVYMIMGVPEATIKATKMSRLHQDPYNIRRLNYQQQIINQHAEQPLLAGAWNLEAHFMFPKPHGKSKRHFMYPSLISLLRFFDELAHGVIYDDSCLIYEATLVKSYESFEPHSKFVFTRIP